MTLNELKNDVAMLGFESSIEDEECLIASANRALNLLYIDRPVSKTIPISFSSLKTTLVKDFLEHHCEEVITLPLSGRAISFVAHGDGECIIRDSSGSSLLLFNGNKSVIKKRLYNPTSITFQGDFHYTISNLAVFSDEKNTEVIDIPEYTPRRELSPSDYCQDFRAFAGLPKDASGNTIDTAILSDGRISMPFEFSGIIYLTYYRLPRKINGDDGNEKIDIPDECSALLPLLTASFMWLDDDASKAQYYMSLYRDAIVNIKRFSTVRVNTEYRVNGWA